MLIEFLFLGLTTKEREREQILTVLFHLATINETKGNIFKIIKVQIFNYNNNFESIKNLVIDFSSLNTTRCFFFYYF